MVENGSDDKPVDKQDSQNIASLLTAVEQEEARLRQAIEDQLRHKAQADMTNRLAKEEAKLLPEAARLPFGTQLASALEYVKLPAKASAQQAAVHWRIELHGLTRGADPVGIDVLGDVVLGRGVGADDDPDLDLEPYSAFQMGVSRRHALLRPTKNCLYIIDLSSTNGTLYNALRIGSGVTRAILHNDTITLGQLSFTVKIIERPQEPSTDTVIATPDAAEKGEDHTRPLSPGTLRADSPDVPVISIDQKDEPGIKDKSPATQL